MCLGVSADDWCLCCRLSSNIAQHLVLTIIWSGAFAWSDGTTTILISTTDWHRFPTRHRCLIYIWFVAKKSFSELPVFSHHSVVLAVFWFSPTLLCWQCSHQDSCSILRQLHTIFPAKTSSNVEIELFVVLRCSVREVLQWCCVCLMVLWPKRAWEGLVTVSNIVSKVAKRICELI